MTRFVRTLFSVLVVSLISVPLASAQATRTWVSGVGDDVNPCSRTAPCKTFAGAISKTAAGGEISVLDNGSYGALTITKSITINGDSNLASVLASGSTGILINTTAATDRVVIRNVAFLGANTGVNGIRVINVGSLLVEHVTIQQFATDGIVVEAGHAVIKDSTITLVGGVALHSKNTASITVENVMVTNNNVAVLADNGSIVRMSDSSFYNNLTAFGCNTGTPGGGTGSLLTAGNNRKANNTGGAIPVCTPTAGITIQ